jgi:hypothetical protein
MEASRVLGIRLGVAAASYKGPGAYWRAGQA